MTCVKEPLSGVELVQQELRHQELLEGVAAFSTSGTLRPTTTQERALLPDTQALHQEKSHQEFIKVTLYKQFIRIVNLQGTGSTGMQYFIGTSPTSSAVQ